MKKVRLIIRMYTEGLSKKTISEKSGCSRNTVKKYINQFIALGKSFDELNQLSNTALEALFKAEEPSPSSKLEVLRSYFPEMEKALKRKGVTRETLWRKYIEENPDGYRLSQFKEYYRRWIKVSNGTMRIDHKTGDKMYFDYATDLHIKTELSDNKEIRFFILPLMVYSWRILI